MLHLLFVEQRHFVAPYSSKGRSLRTAQAQRGLQSLPRKKLGETTEIFGFAQDDSAVFEVNFHSMCSTPFETTVSVKPGDIDGQNHVNNTVYLRWVQEVATAHWQTIAASEAQEGIGWVVLRHEIDYKAPACMGDEVCCAHGSVKRPGSPLSGSPKCFGVATDNCYQRPGRSGVRSMRKPGGPSACLLKCVSNFRFKLFERKTCPLI
jgi:hypothetical protein